jgi:hypothetical protein
VVKHDTLIFKDEQLGGTLTHVLCPASVKGEKKMSEENLVIRSKGALADSSDELPTDADVYATYSIFLPELIDEVLEKSADNRSSGSS